MRKQIAGLGQPALSVSDLLALPELEHILLYHILPGLWTSDLLQNFRAIGTAKGVEVVAFAEASMGEGKFQFHDSCVDKQTPDPYSCKEQVEFGKCSDPFMSSPLAAAWRGGFCELSCKRCTCDIREGAMCGSVRNTNLCFLFLYSCHTFCCLSTYLILLLSSSRWKLWTSWR